MMRLKIAMVILVMFECLHSKAQPDKKQRRIFSLSVTPGIGTNGINPSRYINLISLNVFAGYSEAFRIVELSGLSSFTRGSSSGIQISGFTNIVGGDFNDKRSIKKEQVETNFRGFQASALFNYVRGQTIGFQIALLNITQEDFIGFQLGFGNISRRNGAGLQTGVLFNLNKSGTFGLQAAGMLNATGQLSGIQVGSVNIGRLMSPKEKKFLAAQIGLLNILPGKGKAVQIGLINYSEYPTGIQVGLVNIYKNNQSGSPIGLLNIGHGAGTIRLWATDLFITNVGISLGSEKLQNQIFYSYNPMILEFPRKGIGYGLHKTMTSRSGSAAVEVGCNGSWITYTNSFKSKPRSFLLSAQISHESQLFKGIYIFYGLSLNLLNKVDTQKPSGLFEKIAIESNGYRFWPGLMLGFATK